MKRFFLLFLLMMTLSSATVSCTTVNSVRMRVEVALGMEPSIYSSESVVIEQRESDNLGYAIATFALIGIAFLAIVAMALSNSYV